MDYCVSQKNRDIMEKIWGMPKVQDALRFLEEEQDYSTEEQIELCLIEAPTYREKARAERYAEKFRELGIVQNVSMDEKYDVTGVIPGASDERLLLEAHLDTVFPFGTVKEVRREGNMLYAPGIYDNARGLAVLLAALRALKRTGLKLGKTLIVAGTTREESPGCGAGMRDLLDRYPDLKATISVDGGFITGINACGKFAESVEYRFLGIGGHAGNNYGKVANPLGAACRAVAKINEMIVPAESVSSVSATELFTPEGNGLGSIPGSCTLHLSFRSESRADFEWLDKKIDECVRQGCEEETKRWGQDEIRFEKEVLNYLPGGYQDPHEPIIEAHYLAAEFLGEEPYFRGGSSNGNIAIDRKIPATTVGSGLGNRRGHSLSELFCTDRAYLCPQGLLLLLLMVCGIDGETPPCLTD